MKHPSSRDMYAYWDALRGEATAPDRNALEPGPVRHVLGDAFVLSCDLGFPFRVAGTRLCALVGRDLKGHDFIRLWSDTARAEVEDVLGVVMEEALAAVAGVVARTDDGRPLPLELLLLPLTARTHAPRSLAGVMAPLTVPERPGHCALHGLSLSGLRYMGHRPQPARRRALRRWSMARGLLVYEGIAGR